MFLVLVFTPQVCCLGRFIDVANEIKQETSNQPRHVRLSPFWMCISTVNLCVCVCEEEGGELDSHEEASPEEIKRREVSWTLTKKLAEKRSRAGR